MNQCYLCLGSNQRQPERQIRQALSALRALPFTILVKVSSLYWNPAWGCQVQQDFCNVVVEINTLLPPLKLLRLCQNIEKRQGRVRKKRWGPRTLDIDIILYEKCSLNSPLLTIPHPRMRYREFVLKPLREINPSLFEGLAIL